MGSFFSLAIHSRESREQIGCTLSGWNTRTLTSIKETLDNHGHLRGSHKQKGRIAISSQRATPTLTRREEWKERWVTIN